MKITDDRARDLLRWLDDMAGDHALLFEQMTLYRDAAALIRQLRAAEQSAWHAGLDAGREPGRGKERAGAKAAEIEALKVEVAAQRARADAMAGEAIKHEARAERLAEALRALVPFAQHHDRCGDHDAYNNSQVQTCGCGLDGLLERSAALRDHGQEVDNGWPC